MNDYKISNSEIKFVQGITNNSQLESWFAKKQFSVGVVFTGRSNVGKSSLINALTVKKLARVSNTPGRTKEINVFQFAPAGMENEEGIEFFLYDLPGYGHASVSKQISKDWNILMGEFFQILPDSNLVINIQDARHPLQKNDSEFLEFLQSYCQSEILVAFNKMDKLKNQKERSKFQKTIKENLRNLTRVKYIHNVSAEKKTGLVEFVGTLFNHLAKFKK